MGYDLHITRSKDDWTAAADDPVDPSLWRTIAAGLPEYGSVGDTPVYCLRPDGPSLYLTEGEVRVAGADEPDVPELVALAARLDAYLVGDDDEIYGPDPT